jgi:hypothetical protein
MKGMNRSLISNKQIQLGTRLAPGHSSASLTNLAISPFPSLKGTKEEQFRVSDPMEAQKQKQSGGDEKSQSQSAATAAQSSQYRQYTYPLHQQQQQQQYGTFQPSLPAYSQPAIGFPQPSPPPGSAVALPPHATNFRYFQFYSFFFFLIYCGQIGSSLRLRM